MSFTGKATFSAGVGPPEIAEDVSDLVSIVSPYETPLLHLLGDSMREARSTVHEWLEDQLLPNFDSFSGAITDALNQTSLGVANVARFRVGDQVRIGDKSEAMLVTGVDAIGGAITVVRGYGASARTALTVGVVLHILGNAALEGDTAEAARFTLRARQQNFTQIFSSTVEVSGSELAVRQAGVADELNYQKQLRLRELLRDLENCVINGRAAAANPQGSTTIRRTMNGLVPMINQNVFVAGFGAMPIETQLTEEALNTALREVWMSSGSPVDLILVAAAQKRQINSFMAANRKFTSADQTFRDLVSVYESDFGVCRVALSRYVPQGTVLLLDSTRIEVLPLAGRSFFYKPLASTGDRESGQLVGEYTLELRNANAHGIITGLD